MDKPLAPDGEFAWSVPQPHCEAVIHHDGISWPIKTEAQAYDLAKRFGLPGFWRRKDRLSARRKDRAS